MKLNYMRGFKPNYYKWYSHSEKCNTGGSAIEMTVSTKEIVGDDNNLYKHIILIYNFKCSF